MRTFSLEVWFSTYPLGQVYSLANRLGRRLINYLGKDKFALLLESELLSGSVCRDAVYFSDHSYKLHPAALALEGFLKKLIDGQHLKENTNDNIGEVFGKKDSLVRFKIRNRKLIAKTKSVWDFCRNDVMHYSNASSYRFRPAWHNVRERYQEIVEIIEMLYADFYGKSEPDKEIKDGYYKYIYPAPTRVMRNIRLKRFLRSLLSKI